MKNEDTLKQIFQEFQPDMGDSEQFMEQLNKKLIAMDFVKQEQQKHLRRYKYMVLVAFIVGIIFGGGVFAFMLTHPQTAFHFTFKSQSQLAMLLEAHSHIITLVIIALLMCVAIFSAYMITQNIFNYKDAVQRLKKSHQE